MSRHLNWKALAEIGGDHILGFAAFAVDAGEIAGLPIRRCVALSWLTRPF